MEDSTDKELQAEEALTETVSEADVDETIKTETASQKPMTKKQQFIQLLKFTGFSISAAVIQVLSTTTLHQWTG